MHRCSQDDRNAKARSQQRKSLEFLFGEHNPKSEVEFLQWGKENHGLHGFHGFFGLDLLTICNFGEVANETYFNPCNQ
jgi:hypothetical protein